MTEKTLTNEQAEFAQMLLDNPQAALSGGERRELRRRLRRASRFPAPRLNPRSRIKSLEEFEKFISGI